jgi:hypothetical protein
VGDFDSHVDKDVEDRLIKVLQDAGGSLPLQKVRADLQLGMDSTRLLSSMGARGLVIISGEPGGERIGLAAK